MRLLGLASAARAGASVTPEAADSAVVAGDDSSSSRLWPSLVQTFFSTMPSVAVDGPSSMPIESIGRWIALVGPASDLFGVVSGAGESVVASDTTGEAVMALPASSEAGGWPLMFVADFPPQQDILLSCLDL